MCGHVPAGELHLEHVGMPERVRMRGGGRTAWVLVVRRSKGMALRLVISGGMSASSASVACPWPQLAGGGLPCCCCCCCYAEASELQHTLLLPASALPAGEEGQQQNEEFILTERLQEKKASQECKSSLIKAKPVGLATCNKRCFNE